MLKRHTVMSLTLTGISALAISIFLVHHFDTEPLGGYVAAYTVAAMWGLSVLLGVCGLGLLIGRGTRWVGEMAIVAGVAIPCFFLAGIRISESEGWVSWLNEPLQRIAGADVQVGEVVYYKSGVTNAQMESFQQAVLDQPRADGKGSDLMPGITYFWKLGPSQAHGHDGFAIGISPSMPKINRDRLRASLAQSPLVFDVYHDIAPGEVPVP
jgi:hypothetical protein